LKRAGSWTRSYRSRVAGDLTVDWFLRSLIREIEPTLQLPARLYLFISGSLSDPRNYSDLCGLICWRHGRLVSVQKAPSASPSPSGVIESKSSRFWKAWVRVQVHWYQF